MRMMTQAKYRFSNPDKAEMAYKDIRARLNSFVMAEQGFYSPRNNGNLVESELIRQDSESAPIL